MNSAIHEAAASGDVDMVVSLITRYPHLIDATHQDLYDRTPMFVAATSGHAAVVETLHRLGSKALDQPNAMGWTPMHAAASDGHLSVVETLHRLGGSLDQPDRYGASPMQVAACAGQATVVETLFRLGSAVLVHSGEYIMQLAVHYGRTSVAKVLFAAGVDVDALSERYPHQIQALRAERLQHRLYFSLTLLDMLLVALL